METIIRLLLAGLVIAALYLTLRLLRQRGLLIAAGPKMIQGGNRRMVVEERLLITAQQGLCVVRVDGLQYLLAYGPAGTAVVPHQAAQKEQE